MLDRELRRRFRYWGATLGVFLLGVLYYQVGNRLFAPDAAIAREHGLALWAFQQRLGLDWEPAIQAAMDRMTLFGQPIVAIVLVMFYVGPHFVLTLGFLGWAYWWRFDRFAAVRNVFLIFTLTSFAFQWAYPLAPPWLLPETELRYTLREWLPVTGESPAIQAATNQYAAMPSVHSGWSILVAFFGIMLSKSRWRFLWLLYPGAIILSVLGTGNHFVLDVVFAVPFLAFAFGADLVLRAQPAPRMGDSLPPPVWNGAEPDLERRMKRLAALTARPRSLQHPRNWAAGARLFWDYALTVPPLMARVSPKIRHYPAPFEKVRIATRDGIELVGWLGVHAQERRPALIIIPGLFTSKDNAVVKRRALRVFREWGFHVLTFDLRGNGESDRRVPSTAGWKEAQDLVDVATWFRGQAEIDGLGLYGESLAASAAILAAHAAQEEGRPFADRGVLAVSGFGDVFETIKLYADPPKSPRQLREVVKFFTALLRLSGSSAKSFKEYHEAASRHYGIDPDEAARRSSPVHVVTTLRDPVLVLHSEDDTLVPIAQVEPLLRRVPKGGSLAVWFLPWGHHCLYEMADPRWFWSVLEGFFGANPPGSDRASETAVTVASAGRRAFK